MFTYVELENFKSFGKIKFDFKKTKNEFKKFVAIYGENGSGKSNFVSTIELLSQLLTSFSNRDYRLRQIQSMANDETQKQELVNQIISGKINIGDVYVNLKKYRMLNCSEPTKITYGFLINGIEGYYSISFNDDYIINEELYYMNSKQRGVLFNISKEDNIKVKISPTLFNDDKFEKELNNQIEMFWGKYTFLSILLGEKKDKNIEYINNTISHHLLNVINSFMHIFVLCKDSPYSHIQIITGPNVKIRNLSRVHVDPNNKNHYIHLKKMEKIIKDFYTQAYSDIVDIYYDLNTSFSNNDNMEEYVLYVKKIIAGKTRVIPFGLESSGTQSVLSVLRAIIEAIDGNTVIYDEIDNGIHDLLMKNALISLQEEIKGQLIITTHNTLLLEGIDSKSAYVIYTDYDGNKEARCFDDYDVRIQTSNNQRRLYLNGVFGGIPYSSEIDYSRMHMSETGTMEE